jgi:ubiquinone/menaquinone biosynthesis C-methylase UbiE
MKKPYNKEPLAIIKSINRNISVFSTEGDNIDLNVVETFGDEWLKFKTFPEADLLKLSKEYFDILGENIVNKNTYGLDIGCGTGRWTKCLSDRIGFMEAIDPSNAVLAADSLLTNIENVRITKASVENIPFDDETFDFAMSIGVLHHIPDTQKAMEDCVKKVKKGGYFYCYLYYNLDNRNVFFKSLFWLSNLLRFIVSSFPSKLKKVTCEFLAIFLYMPFVFFSRFLIFFGFKTLTKKIPLNDYADKTFFIIRNDSLDRFGTKLEQRFSKKQVVEMMKKSGLDEIVVGNNSPYYHAVGKRN